MPQTRAKFLRSGIVILIVGFVLLGVVFAATVSLVGSGRQAREAGRHALEVESLLYRVLSLVQDAETGQRGYLLTGDPAYLGPHTDAVGAVGRELKTLAAEIANQSRQAAQLAALQSEATAKLAELQATIDRYRAGKTDEAVAMVRTGRGKAMMDGIRATIGRMVAEERRMLDGYQADAGRASTGFQIGIGAAAVLFLALGVFAVWHTQRQMRHLTDSGQALRSANERLVDEAMQRERLEAQLRQSQKLEAVGQLTGGIAHDFNNMLAVIIASLNLLKRRLARGESDVEKFMDAAMDGAERAAKLTHRLLAFSRQQPLAPESIDANKFVAGMSDLLHRTLGEQVRLETVLAGGLWRTHADAGQLENAILNLAVNARDAMADGGRLTIETANCHLDDTYSASHVEVPAGQYVLVAVTDTGCGMPPEVIAKAFDPFFTTKGVGKGTGLGLSQVFGFVKQSGGHVTIYSEPGQGTTVKLYLPRFFGAIEPEAAKAAGILAPLGKASEIILVVEDEERARLVAVESLRELGYTVLHADGAATALRILDAHPDIALLFTDIVMPDVNGKKLADEAVRRQPGLKVLYTTGYTRNAIVHNGVLDPGVQLISKPFTLDNLALKVREVLEAP